MSPTRPAAPATDALRFATRDGVRLAYAVDGPEDAPAVVMGHCFMADHRYWDPHLPASEGFRRIRFDIRGHGDSDLGDGPYDLAMLAADVEAIMDREGMARAHYMGVSLSGMIGQTLAIHRPGRLKSLALVTTTACYDEPQRQLWKERGEAVLSDGIAPLRAQLMQRWFTDTALAANAPGPRYIGGCLDRGRPEAFAYATAAMRGLDTVGGLSSIQTPTVVIAAPEDPGVPQAMSELLAARIPGATLHWLTPARHLATLEHVEETNAILRAHMEAASR